MTSRSEGPKSRTDYIAATDPGADEPDVIILHVGGLAIVTDLENLTGAMQRFNVQWRPAVAAVEAFCEEFREQIQAFNRDVERQSRPAPWEAPDRAHDRRFRARPGKRGRR